MKKTIKSMCFMTILLAFILSPFIYTASAADKKKEVDWSLWDRFIKYDLRITDYDSLTDKEKELCKYIFETERSSEDTIICARARQILAGYDVGKRITLEQAEHYYDIMDSSYLDGAICCLCDPLTDKLYANDLYNKPILRKVPDIKHLDYDINCNEYWLDDKGSERILTFGEGAIYPNEDLKDVYLYEKYDENGERIDLQVIPRVNEELETIENDGCIYKIYPDNTLALSEHTDKSRLSVSIPEYIDGMPVTCIKPYAFSESAISEIVLPDSLKYIEPFAFNECKNLSKINFPKSLESIGGSAFYDCVFMGDILIDCPELQVPSGPFSETCAKNVTVNIKTVTNWLMTSFEKFETFTMGNNVREIGSNFLNKEFIIPKNVKVISGEWGCIPFENLTIPVNIEIFGAYKKASGTIGGSCIDSPARIPLLENNSILDSDCVVNGWYGTEAHSYALAYNLKFNPLDDITYGDANNDGEINITDAVALKKYLIKSDTVGYEADFNRDGRINVFDMILLKRNLINSKI